MHAFVFRIESPVELVHTGKFMAPSPEWIHLNRLMIDYELILVTEGVLYIGGDQEHYTVQKGEYLLMPPLTNQYRYKSSECSFYWLHFTARNALMKVDAGQSVAESGERIVIPQQKALNTPEKIIVMMKQLQDAVRSYNEKNLNNYMTTAILCELFNQASGTAWNLFQHACLRAPTPAQYVPFPNFTRPIHGASVPAVIQYRGTAKFI